MTRARPSSGNRELFLKELGVANGRRSWPLVSLRQIHSD